MSKLSFILISSIYVSAVAGDFSAMKAYDLAAEGKCSDAINLISEEMDQIFFRMNKERQREGEHIIENIKNACGYIATAKECFKQIDECRPNMLCTTVDRWKFGENTYSDWKGLNAMQEGSPKLKAVIAKVNAQRKDYEELGAWKQAGYFDVEEINLFRKNAISVDTAVLWNAGTRATSNLKRGEKNLFSVQEMIDWRKVGFDYTTASNLFQLGVSSSLLKMKEKRYNYFKLKESENNYMEIANWLKCDVGDDLLFKWAEISKTCEDVKMWLAENVNFEDVKKWGAFNVDTQTAINLMKSGVDYDELSKWAGLGFSLDQIMLWREAEISPKEAIEWKEINIDVAKAVAWKKEGFTAKNEEVSRWSHTSLLPSDAKPYIKNRIDASEYLMFSLLGESSPQKISAMLDKVRQKCKIAKNKYVADNTGLISEIGNENPYETKGKCYGGNLYFSQLKSKNEAYFLNANEQPVFVKWNKSIPVNGSVFGFFYSKGASIHKNALGVKVIIPDLEAVILMESNLEE